MKKTVLLVIMVCILLIAGCTTQSSNAGSSGTVPPTPSSANPPGQSNSLPMDGHIVYTTAHTTFEVWIDSIEVDAVQENDDLSITIYVVAKNTGTKPIRLVWFSRLTDLNGKTYGGIGLSHSGSGARSNWIQPNMSEAARDYVTIRSDRDLTALAKGAVLDVYFMEKPSDDIPVSLVSDYHTSWIINPGAIQ